MPSLDDPKRRIEELRLDQLRNFLLLLLARSGDDLPGTPAEALERWASGLDGLTTYGNQLSLPLTGTPDSVVSGLRLGQPNSELFKLQEKLVDELDDEGRRVLVELGKLF